MNNIAAIVLAAGAGTRFNKGKPSPKPKVLYEVAGIPLIFYSIEILKKIGIREVVVVVGYKGEEIKRLVGIGRRYRYALQEKPLGTGDATLAGTKRLSEEVDNVMVLYGGDIYSEKTLNGALNTHLRENPVITFVTKVLADPAGYGRIVRNQKGDITAIVEEKVATTAQKKIKEVNDGCYIFQRDWLLKNIKSLSLSGTKEYFLTDLVEIAIQQGSRVSTYTIKDLVDWIGVDSLEDIINAEKHFEWKKR